MKKLILAIAIFLGASPLWAELMTYQGRLKEAGIPASGNRLFTFEFCDQEDGSGVCLVAPGTPANFAVANGLFKSTITIHPSVDLAAGAWYLRVTVGSSVLAPLERLTAVPYSVFASSAGYAAGAVLKAGDTMTGQLTLAGSTLTVTGNEFSVGGSTFVVKSGYVGIGTASPNNPLEVHTNGQYVFTGVATGASAVLNLVPQTGGTVMLNNNAVGPVALAVGHTKHLLVDESGNVGISSVTPSYRLVVSSGAGEAGTIMAVSTGTSNLFWVEGDGAHATRFHGDGSGLTGVTGATGTDPNALQLTGGTMQGAIDMDGNFLSGVSTITMQGGSIAIVPPGTGGTNVGYGISIGSNSYSNSDSGIGIGYSAYLNSYYSVGLGAFASENGSYGVGIGAFASRNYNSGVGVGAEASENFQNGTGIGHSAKNNDNYGVGVGAYAQNNDNYAVGVGAYSQYNAGFGAALGAYSYASSSATALGAQAKANAELSLALGYGTVNNSTGTASFGSYGVSAPYYQVSGSTVLALGVGINSNTLKVGPMAGAVNYGQFNVFVGSAAGKVNSSGIHNVLVGHDAGSANITGTGNTFIGSAAGSANISGLQNIVIGYNQQTSASNSASELNIGGLIFGQLGVKTVGISTRAPQAALDIVSTGTAHTQMAQIWRDSTGLIVGSMSVTGSLQAVRFIGDGSGLTGVTSAGAVQKAGDTMTGPLHILSDDLLSDTSDFITTGLVISTGGAIRTTGIGHGTVAGNPRGIGAVDLQTVRALSAQTASGSYSVLSGGFRNTSSSIYSTVGGGYTNSASGVAAVVGGGWENSASGLRSVISGGETNSASAYYSTVGGGIDNVVSGHSSAVSGGVFNVVSGSNSVVGGGAYNTVVGTSAVVAGGEYNIASGMHSSVGGGLSNAASNAYSYVGGGQANSASANHAVVAGGQGNAAISAQSAVAGGAGNRAEAQYAFVGGGNDNRASGMYATVPGGYNNTAKANYSFAAGGRSSSTAQGAFTWQDSGGAAINLVNDVTDRTVFKSRGGFLVTGSTNTSMTGTLDRGVFITGEGRVGVSTGAPQAALDVLAAGNTVSDYTQIWRDSDGVTRASVTATGVFYGDGSGLTGVTSAGAVQKTGDTMTGALLLPQGTAAVPSLSFSGDENTGFYSPGQDQLAFATAGTERLRVTDAGRVGIGIASPAEALDISGRVLISTNAGGNPVTDGLLSNGAGGMVFYSGATKYMHVGYGGEHIGIGPGAGIQSDLLSPRLQLKGSMSVGATYNLAHPPANSLVVENRLGVGTPAPDAALSVVQSDVVASSYTVHVGTSASAYHLVVTTGGWVGINTQRPQAPLHLTVATRDEGIVVEHNSNTTEASYLALVKARGTADSQSIVADGDNLGVLAFGGYNAAPGDPFPTAAAIVGRVDGVAGISPATDMPGRLEFMTAADGTTETLTRMVIRNDGGVGIATGTPQAMLDIRSTATVAQIWRDAGGVIRASMTASGVLYAQVDALSSKVSKTGDNMSGNLTISVDPALYTYDFATTGIQVSTAGSIVTVGVGNGISGAGVRGMGAVDLQTAREVSGQVALGDFSTLSGGAYNTVLGSNTVVAGGRYNIGAGTSAVISGGEGNYAASYFGTIGGGKGNSAYGSHSAIFSGADNLAEEMFAFVGSGYGNTASTAYSVVAGGYNNVAGVSGGDGEGSFIGGGRNNTVNQNYGAIAGGMNNAVGDFADYAFIGGGYENDANGTHSAVAGGWWNVANGADSFVGAGNFNTVDGANGVISGGYQNKLQSSALAAFIGGGRDNTITAGMEKAVIVGGSSNTVSGLYGFIGAGGPVNPGDPGNKVLADYSAIVGGSENLADAGSWMSFIGGGSENTVSGQQSVVAGGWMNTAGAASEYYAGVVAGWGNKALGGSSFVGAGGGNHATGDNSVVAGGSSNMATGGDSAVPGGSNNTAKGNYSFAAGYMSSSTANGTFTWADSKGVVVENSVGDQVMFKAAGGFWVSTGTAYADPALYVSNANKVGIGTNTPGFKLHVKDLAGGAIAGLTSSPSSTDAGVYGWSNSAATAIKGVAGSGYAGRFEGNVFITNDGVNPVNPAKLQVNGDLGLGDGSQIGNTPIVIWLTASTSFADGDVVVASGNNQFGTTGVASASTVIGVAMGSGAIASTAKIAVAGVVVANCINGAFGQHAVTSATLGAVGGVGLPSSGTSVGLFLTNCLSGKATLLLK